MAELYSSLQLVSDGTLQSVTLTFPYTSREEIHVFLDGSEVTTGWGWAGPTGETLEFDTPVPSGTKVLVRRITKIDEVPYIFGPAAGSRGYAEFSAYTVDFNFDFVKRASQDALDSFTLSGTTAEAAESWALLAQTYASQSQASAGLAGSRASQAAASQGAAHGSELKAKAWADNPVGTEVEPGKFSARHWAEISKEHTALGLREDLADPTKGTNLVAFGTRLLTDKLKDVVSVEDFGAVGDGVTDDTSALRTALQAAEGKVLLLGAGKVYLFDPQIGLEIMPGTQVVSCGSRFLNLKPTTKYGITFHQDSGMDHLALDFNLLSVDAPNTRGVQIAGSNVVVDKFTLISDTPGTGRGFNARVALMIGTGEGAPLVGVSVGSVTVKNFDRPVTCQNITRSLLGPVYSERYVRAIYLRDCSHFYLGGGHCHTISSNSTGGPGENGLLIESATAPNSSNNIRVEGYTVEDAGEHSFRLGGQRTISNVWFYKCSSARSGSSIVVGNPAATEWHGGCGFKILGGTTSLGQRHKNIYFDECHVEDCNVSPGSFPQGHGNGNYAGFQIAVAENIHLNSCTVTNQAQAESAGYGAEVLASSHVYFNECNFVNCRTYGIRIYEVADDSSYPGWLLPCDNVVINGGFIQAGTVPIFVGGDIRHYWGLRCHGVLLSGGDYAVRMNVPTSGSYAQCFWDFTYINPSRDPETSTAQYTYGTADAVLNVRGPWALGTATTPQAAPGSLWQDTHSGSFWFRRGTAWQTCLFEDAINRQSNSSNLASATATINTVRKFTGMLVQNNSNQKLYRASGPSPTSFWTAVDGSERIDPV